MARQIKPYMDFRGGLNTDAAPDNLADNELMECINADLSERGAISKRKGTVPLNNESYNAQVERIIEWPRKDGSRILLAVIGTTLAEINQIDGTPTQIKVLDNADIGHFFYADNFYFAGKENGKDNYWRYDGENVEVVQVDPPETGPTLAGSGSGTNLDAGTYKALVTFVGSSGVESVSSPEATVTITQGQQIDWTDIPVGPEGTLKRKCYRTKKGGEVFYLIREIDDNTTTNFTDTMGDSSIDDKTPQYKHNDLAPIKRCRRFIWHPKSQRIFAGRDSDDMAALYYSEYGDPTFFKETSKVYPTTGDGVINALSYFGEAMIVFYQNSEWVWKGADPASDAEWYKLFSNCGTPAFKSVALTPSSLTVLSQGGIMSLSPALIDSDIAMVVGEDLVSNKSENKVMSIIKSITNKQSAAGVYDNMEGKYLLAYDDIQGIYYPDTLSVPEDYELDLDKEFDEYAGAEGLINYMFNTEFTPRNSKVLVLDWTLKSFVTYEGLQINDFCMRSNGELLIASNNYILKMWQGHKDFDVDTGEYVPINWKVRFKHWNLDLPFHVKKIKKLFIGAKQFEDEHSSIDVDVKIDYENYSLSALDLNESFLWGESVWGESVWGWADLITKEAKINSKGMRVQVTLTNNVIDEPVTIYGMAFEYKPKKPKGVRVN